MQFADAVWLRLWTSAEQLPWKKNMSPEICSIINETIRLDNPAMLQHTVPLALAINELSIVRGARDASQVHFPLGGILWRAGGLPREHMGFYQPGIKYRVPGFFATSSSKEVTDNFAYRAYDQGSPVVRWQILLDSRGEESMLYRCKHVNYVTSSHSQGEEA